MQMPCTSENEWFQYVILIYLQKLNQQEVDAYWLFLATVAKSEVFFYLKAFR